MEQDTNKPKFNDFHELKRIKELEIISKVKEFTYTFGTGISVVLMQDTCRFVELELQEILEELHELNEDAVLRINNGVFSRTAAAELLLGLVESSKMIDHYDSKINANPIKRELCKN